MGFLLLSISFFVLGVLCFLKPKSAVILFIILAILAPTSSSFSSLTYLNGIFALDAFFLPLLILVCVRVSIIKFIQLNKSEIFLCLVPIFIFIVYFVISIYKTGFSTELLKEIRPLIFLFETMVFLIFIRQINFKISFKFVSKLAIIAALSNCVFYLFLYFGVFVSDDIFYINNNYRYLDLSTYFSVYFIIHFLLSSEKLNINRSYYHKIAIFLSFISVIISNSRFIIFALFLALILSNVSNYKFFFKRVFQAFFVLLLFLIFSFMIDSTRVINALNVDAIVMQFSNRYLPALIDIYKMNNSQLIFGYGLGHYFEISWFEYRKLIDNENISIDCAYLTAYVINSTFGKHKLSLLIFWITMFVVSSSFYQVYTYGGIIYLAFLNNEIK